MAKTTTRTEPGKIAFDAYWETPSARWDEMSDLGKAKWAQAEAKIVSALGGRAPDLRIVFDGPPGPEAGRFVEVECAHGNSINVGAWHARGDGLHELRLADDPVSLNLSTAVEG